MAGLKRTFLYTHVHIFYERDDTLKIMVIDFAVTFRILNLIQNTKKNYFYYFGAQVQLISCFYNDTRAVLIARMNEEFSCFFLRRILWVNLKDKKLANTALLSKDLCSANKMGVSYLSIFSSNTGMNVIIFYSLYTLCCTAIHIFRLKFKWQITYFYGVTISRFEGDKNLHPKNIYLNVIL